jgi:Xaa-Pro aminopeptidase
MPEQMDRRRIFHGNEKERPTMERTGMVGGAQGGGSLVLPMRQRAQIVRQVLAERLDTILADAMRENGFDMWIIICQEDNLDPVFQTMIPIDTWCPILQMLVFYDRGAREGVERINLSMTRMGELYERPWQGHDPQEQWTLLGKIVQERDPQRIGINTGSIQWAAGGLTHNLYRQLLAALPEPYGKRLESAEPMATQWLSTLTARELGLYAHVARVAHRLLGECFSRQAIVPGVTTTTDLEWYYWQRCADLGLQVSFKPFFNLLRSDDMRATYGEQDQVIRPGDVIHSDVGIKYLRLTSDHQECAYVLRPGEEEAPAGLQALIGAVNHLQEVFMAEFQAGLSGNELLHNILARARAKGIAQPKVYSHSLGLFLHEPGPLIGLPWEQERCVGRGDVRLREGNCFTMELSVCQPVPEWNNQEVTMSLEQDVAFTAAGCRPIDGRQTALHLI